MKASDFEYRHQTLIHLAIVGVAFMTYLIDRDDIVWKLVRSQSHPAILERSLFAIATLLMIASTALRTRARTHGSESKEQLGNLLFSIGLGSLAPVAGFVIIVAGEGIVFIRLVRRGRGSAPAPRVTWAKAFRQESAKWGLCVTMVVFTILLQDRVAEILAVASVVIWILLTGGDFFARVTPQS